MKDVEAFEWEPPRHVFDSDFELPQIVCDCKGGASWCKLLTGDLDWLTSNFGCQYVEKFSMVFEISPKCGEPYFSKKGAMAKQLRPFVLLDKRLEWDILNFICRCKTARRILRTKCEIKESPIKGPLRAVHERLRNVLKDTLKNGVRSLLRYHLNELNPLSRDQLTIIPKLTIQLAVGCECTVDLFVRKRKQRKQDFKCFKDGLQEIEN